VTALKQVRKRAKAAAGKVTGAARTLASSVRVAQVLAVLAVLRAAVLTARRTA
jgi:DNA-binding FrmR family transcriptional regulator